MRQREPAVGESGSAAISEITFQSCCPENNSVGMAVGRALLRQGMEVPGKVTDRETVIN